MGIQTEQAIIDLKINGAPAAATVQEMTKQINYLTNAVTNMHKADNPALYASRLAQIQALTVARKAEIDAINGGTAGVNKFQAAISRATDLNTIGARVVNMFSREIIGLGVGMLSITIGAKALESLGKWILQLKMFNPTASEAKLKMDALNAAFASSDYTGAIENVIQLTEDIKLAKNGFLDKTKVLKEYNDKLGATMGYTDKLDVAEQNIVKHGDAYIKMTLYKASAQLALQSATKAMYEAAQIAAKPTKDAVGDVDMGMDLVTTPEKHKAALKKMQDDQVAEKQKSADLQLKIFNDFREQAAKIAKENKLDFFDGTEDPEKGKKAKSGDSQDKYLAESKALSEKIREFNATELADTLAKNDKEVQDLQNKYDKEIAQTQAQLDKMKKSKYATDDDIAKHQGEIDKLSTDKTKAVADLKLKQEKELSEKIQAIRDQMNGKLETELQKETDLINKQFDELLKNAGTNADARKQIEDNRAQALLEASTREEQRLQDEKANIQDEGDLNDEDKLKVKLTKINQHYDQELKDLKASYGDKIKTTKEYQDAIDAILGNKKKATQDAIDEDKAKKKAKESEIEIHAAKTTASTLFEITRSNRQNELNLKISSLESQRNAELSNQNLTQTQKDAINKKFNDQESEVKRKAWKADQVAAIEQAIINGALAMTKVAAQTGVLSFAFDPIIAFETAAQIALIASQQAPQFAKGGILPVGPSHADGGINLVGPYGTVMGNIEGGEPILSKQTYASNKGVVDALLNSKGKTLNYDRISNATTSREIRHGGTTKTPAPVAGNNSSGVSGTDMSATNALLSGLHDKFDAFANKPWEFPMKQFYIADNKNKQVQGNANA